MALRMAALWQPDASAGAGIQMAGRISRKRVHQWRNTPLRERSQQWGIGVNRRRRPPETRQALSYLNQSAIE